MPYCHKCPHNAEIARLRSICAACAGPAEDSRRGVNTVSLDAMDEQPLLRPAPDWGHPEDGTRSRIAEAVPPEFMSLFLDKLRPLWAMTFAESVVFSGKVRGMTDRQIADAVHWSKQRVYTTKERIHRQYPDLGVVRTGFDGLRGGGRRPRERPTDDGQQQLALFKAI